MDNESKENGYPNKPPPVPKYQKFINIYISFLISGGTTPPLGALCDLNPNWTKYLWHLYHL